VLAFAAFIPFACEAQPTQVRLSGLAFAGDAASLEQFFPHSHRYEAALAKVSDGTVFTVNLPEAVQIGMQWRSFRCV
jgi:hypothetical protein